MPISKADERPKTCGDKAGRLGLFLSGLRLKLNSGGKSSARASISRVQQRYTATAMSWLLRFVKIRFGVPMLERFAYVLVGYLPPDLFDTMIPDACEDSR